MNRLKKLIFGLTLAATSVAFCDMETEQKGNEAPTTEIRNNYNYWGIGVGFPGFIAAKFGHREQIGRRGFEYGGGVTPLIVVTEAHVFANALLYPNPNLKGQTYLGLGLRGGGILEFKRAGFAYVAPGFIIGRERLTSDNQRRFTQLALGFGALTTEGACYLPSISVTFGYGF